MVYSQGEKEKMALLLDMFQSFIREQSYFDIVYSEKLGYLRIVPGNETTDDQVFRISTFDDLLKTLVDDMIFEQMRPNPGLAPSPADFEAVRHVCEDKLLFSPEENRRCMKIIEDSIANWKQDASFES